MLKNSNKLHTLLYYFVCAFIFPALALTHEISTINLIDITQSPEYSKWINNNYAPAIRAYVTSNKSKISSDKEVIDEAFKFKFFMTDFYNGLNSIGINISKRIPLFYKCTYSNGLNTNFCNTTTQALSREFQVLKRLIEYSNKYVCELIEKVDKDNNCSTNKDFISLKKRISDTVSRNQKNIKAKEINSRVNISNDIYEEKRKSFIIENNHITKLLYTKNETDRANYFENMLKKNIYSFLKQKNIDVFKRNSLDLISGTENLISKFIKAKDKDIRNFGIGLYFYFKNYKKTQTKELSTPLLLPQTDSFEDETEVLASYLLSSQVLNTSLYNFLRSVNNSTTIIELLSILEGDIEKFIIDLILTLSHVNTYHPITYVRNVRDMMIELSKWSNFWKLEKEYSTKVYSILNQLLKKNLISKKETKPHAVEEFIDYYRLLKSTDGNLITGLYIDSYSPRLENYNHFSKLFYQQTQNIDLTKQKVTNMINTEKKSISFYSSNIDLDIINSGELGPVGKTDTTCKLYRSRKFLQIKIQQLSNSEAGSLTEYLRNIANACLISVFYEIPLHTGKLSSSKNEIVLKSFLFDDVNFNELFSTAVKDLAIIQRSTIINEFVDALEESISFSNKKTSSLHRDWLSFGSIYESNIEDKIQTYGFSEKDQSLFIHVIKYVLARNKVILLNREITQ